jgi:hypothetical protein
MTTHYSQPSIQIVAVEYPANVLIHLRKEHGRDAPAKGSDGAIHDAVQQHLTAHMHGQFRGNGHYHVRKAKA